MDPATPTPERSRELADLRRRAYGPDADIHRDPQALRRLHELEEGALPPDPDSGASGGAAESEAGDAGPGPASDSRSDSPEEVDAVAGRSRWWRSGRLWAVAAVSLVCGLAIGASAIAASSAFSEGRPDTTLRITEGAGPAAEWTGNLEYWNVEQDSVVTYEDYDAIQVFTGRGGDGGRCLLLGYRDRIFTASCASADLDPVLDFYAGQWPVFLEEALNPGGVLRFMARPDGVDVWFRPGSAGLPGFED